MIKPKLILLNGFAGVGKTTIANRYISEHPLSMNLEGDRLIVMLGQWLEHEEAARQLVFELSKTVASTHLKAGYDVVIPYLPTTAEHAKEFEKLAEMARAQFIEITLTSNRENAINRLLKRGTWGEEGTNPLEESDLSTIEKLYNDMEKALAERPNAIQISCVENDHDGTYGQFMAAIRQMKE